MQPCMQAVQKEREEKLAKSLRDFLNQYVRGDKDGFMQHAESEARRLSDTGKLSYLRISRVFFPLFYSYRHVLLIRGFFCAN